MDKKPLIVVDKRIPSEAKQALAGFGILMELETEDITYDAISGHPDIFFFQDKNQTIVAPNLPEKYFEILNNYGIKYRKGIKPVGRDYPYSSYYNALQTSYGLLHNTHFTETSLLENVTKTIHCRQGYTRCNAIEIGKTVLTSDKGIMKTLVKHDIPVIYTNPRDIILPGFKNGFWGGCCGIFNQQLFVCGQLDHLENASQIRELLNMEGIKIIELYDGKLFDGGGIFFMETQSY
ncbi:MAG: DUF6873 family GME fold protein [Bacteroidales bacterium]